MDSFTEEGEDLITCAVCFLEFNDEERKPKFLTCSHSACSKCLEAIWREMKIACPMCRKETCAQLGVADLPNNVYALHMLKAKQPLVEDQVLKGQVCLTCEVEAKVSCLKIHPIFNTESNELMQTGGEHLKDLVENVKSCIMEAVTMRLDIDSNCQRILDHLKQLEIGIREHLDGNDIRMAELISVLDTVESWGRHQG